MITRQHSSMPHCTARGCRTIRIGRQRTSRPPLCGPNLREFRSISHADNKIAPISNLIHSSESALAGRRRVGYTSGQGSPMFCRFSHFLVAAFLIVAIVAPPLHLLGLTAGRQNHRSNHKARKLPRLPGVVRVQVDSSASARTPSRRGSEPVCPAARFPAFSLYAGTQSHLQPTVATQSIFRPLRC